MREFWKKTIQFLLYGGLEKEQYKITNPMVGLSISVLIVLLSTHQ